MDGNRPDVKEAMAELLENLGTVGVFILGEMRAFLRKSWGASKEEFFAAVDRTVRTMKQSGRMATADIERAATQIKQAWGLLNQERDLEWDDFLRELTSRLNTLSEVSRETFDLCVRQSKEALDKQWSAMGRLDEEQMKVVGTMTETMAKAFEDQWQVFRDTLQETGKKVDRAVDAAWTELRKKRE